jgi:recombination protein RecA
MLSALAYAKTVEEKTYGGIAQALTVFSKKATTSCTRNHCTVIGINQMRDDMNSMYGGSTTTGGRAWRHNCSVRLQFRKGSYIDENGKELSRACENPAGNIVQCSILKTKVCLANRKIGFYTLNYLEGIDFVSDTIDVAIKESLVLATGAWYSLVDPETGEVLVDEGNKLKFQGKARLKDYLSTNEDAWLNLKNALIKKFL